MMKALILLATALYALAIMGLSRPARAAECAPHPDVAAGLARNYAETVVAMGITANGHLIEVFASPQGTWTIIATDPSGISCMAASGAAFESITAELPPNGIEG